MAESTARQNLKRQRVGRNLQQAEGRYRHLPSDALANALYPQPSGRWVIEYPADQKVRQHW